MGDPSTTSRMRYWCHREGRFLLDQAGFLLDPEGSYGRMLNPDLVRLAELSDRPWLALLGEPGMGKTTAMQDERVAVGHTVETTGNQLIWLDLGEYGDEGRLNRDLFEGEVWDLWREDSRIMHLFLDGLDESRLYLPNVARLLVAQLARLPHRDRLFLRIACRTGAWLPYLEESLKSMWPEERPCVFELVPLRRVDVAEIASTTGVGDIEAFLREVQRRNAVPLATRPVTLRLLAKLYVRGGRLPHTQEELYEQGCRALCEETSPSRRAAGKLGLLNPDQRLAVAARIAATSIFCSRPAIWDGPDLGDRPFNDVTISTLGGGAEVANGAEFSVTDDGIREVLSDTSLFSSRGPCRLGWAHQTYAEYLAARYVRAHGLAIAQVKGLLLHPHLPGKVVPQLHEAAAWLAGMDGEVFRVILTSDPQILLHSDVENAATQDRDALVTALLRAADENQISDVKLDLRRMYHKLVHSGLAVQLGPYIVDKSKGFLSRRMAIDIAEACDISELQELLARVALDRGDGLETRVGAAHAVRQVGDQTTRGRLRALLKSDLEEDIHDELKGCALRALWPDLISADEVFTLLSPPKRESFFGAYELFLHSDLVEGLAPEDLPVALRWAAAQGESHQLLYKVGLLVDQILVRAWDAIEAPVVLEPLADLVWSRIRAHEPLFVSPFHGAESARSGVDGDRRRRLLAALLPRMAECGKSSTYWLMWTNPPLLRLDDFSWLSGRLEVEDDPAIRSVLAKLIHLLFSQAGFSPLDQILDAAWRHPELAREMRDLLTPMKLVSPEADEARKAHQQQMSWQRPRQDQPKLDPPPQERIDRLLVLSESGDLDAWWQLTEVMAIDPARSGHHHVWNTDLTLLPGWLDARPELRSRIIEAAYSYVLDREPELGRWFFHEGTYNHPAAAGLKALRLLRERAPDHIGRLSPNVWGKWVPVLLGYPATGSEDDLRARKALVTEAYKHATDEVIDWLLIYINEYNRREIPHYEEHLVDGCWDDRLAAALLVKVRDPALKPHLMGQLLDDLLGRGVAGAGAFAASLLASPPIEDEARRRRAMVAARSLMIGADGGGWPVVWPLIRAEPDFGRDLMLSVAPTFERSNEARLTALLAEDQVADLYIWLSRQFPHGDDPDFDGAHSGGPREEVARFRDRLLNHLVGRGTLAVLPQIDRVARELPHLARLSFARIQAEQAALERTWTPPKPEHLRALVADREARLVEGGDQLLDVVVESLRRFEQKLQGETPANFMLWDRQHDKRADGCFRPKEEERLSDALKLHLLDDSSGGASSRTARSKSDPDNASHPVRRQTSAWMRSPPARGPGC